MCIRDRSTCVKVGFIIMNSDCCQFIFFSFVVLLGFRSIPGNLLVIVGLHNQFGRPSKGMDFPTRLPPGVIHPYVLSIDV